jgi:hypothetical protein
VHAAGERVEQLCARLVVEVGEHAALHLVDGLVAAREHGEPRLGHRRLEHAPVVGRRRARDEPIALQRRDHLVH